MKSITFLSFFTSLYLTLSQFTGPYAEHPEEFPWLQCRDVGNWMDAGQCSLSCFDIFTND